MSDRLLSPEELEKQRGELEAWLNFARDMGDDFMRGGAPDPSVLEHYRDKILVDIGCGPRPFIEWFPLRIPVMIDCCMLSYAESGLLQPSTYEKVNLVDAMAEKLPIRSGTVDIVFALNMLDHTYRPETVVAEMRRILKVGGALHVHVDVGGEPNVCEPIVFTEERVRGLFDDFKLIFHEEDLPSNPGREKTLRGIFVKETPVGDEEAVDPRDFDELVRSPDDGAPLEREEDDAFLAPSNGRRYPRTGGVWDFRPQD